MQRISPLNCVQHLKITIPRIKTHSVQHNFYLCHFHFILSSTCINECLYFHVFLLCVFNLFYHVVCSLSVSIKSTQFMFTLEFLNEKKTSNNHQLIIIRLIGPVSFNFVRHLNLEACTWFTRVIRMCLRDSIIHSGLEAKQHTTRKTSETLNGLDLFCYA